jgi:hypothetical protein
MTTSTKKYQFDMEEVFLLREAMAELKHLLTPPPDASDQRKLNYRRACALLEQFANDLRGAR